MDADYLGTGWDGDPRGILWLYEEPKPNEIYVLGVDPTIGLSGWNRYARSRDDVDTDNGTIEVIKVGRPPKPDLQVAEYAAPIDAIDIAEVINAVGKIYKGKSEEDAALAIIETTGPGITTVRELLSRYNYPNLWRWMQLDQMKVKRTNSFGWGATRRRSTSSSWAGSSMVSLSGPTFSRRLPVPPPRS